MKMIIHIDYYYGKENKMIELKRYRDLLGLRVKDCVTNFEGIVASISFDLYGCVQALVNSGIGKDGKLQDNVWFDVNRLVVLKSTPVMERPDFCYDKDKGPESKPFLKV